MFVKEGCFYMQVNAHLFPLPEMLIVLADTKAALMVIFLMMFSTPLSDD